MRARLWTAVLGVAALVWGACSTDDDSTVAADRVAFDHAIHEIALELITSKDGDGIPLSFTDECPVLGGKSLTDIVNDSGVDLELDEDEPLGMLSSGWTLRCSNGITRGNSLSVTVEQVRALDASEHAQHVNRRAPELVQAEVSYDGFEHGSLVERRSTGEGGSSAELVWVDDGVAIGVGTRTTTELSDADLGSLLLQVRQVVLETLDSADAGSRPRRTDDLERSQINAAFDAALPQGAHDPEGVILTEGRCPVLSNGAFSRVAEQVGWDPTLRFGSAVIDGRQGTVTCFFGDGPGSRSFTVSLVRAVSVPEFEMYREAVRLGQRDAPAEVLRRLDDSQALGAARAFTMSREDSDRQTAGWLNNGLLITTGPDEDDPVTVLEALVPAVLAQLESDDTESEGGGDDRSEPPARTRSAQVPSQDDCFAILPIESVETITGLSGVVLGFADFNEGESRNVYPVSCSYSTLAGGEVRLLWNWHHANGRYEDQCQGNPDKVPGLGQSACRMVQVSSGNTPSAAPAAGIIFTVDGGASGTLTAYLPDATNPSEIVETLADLAADNMAGM